ncbi:hypothetical protein Hanom_Chr09g00784521 [Helianthus anomalus]
MFFVYKTGYGFKKRVYHLDFDLTINKAQHVAVRAGVRSSRGLLPLKGISGQQQEVEQECGSL